MPPRAVDAAAGRRSKHSTAPPDDRWALRRAGRTAALLRKRRSDALRYSGRSEKTRCSQRRSWRCTTSNRDASRRSAGCCAINSGGRSKSKRSVESGTERNDDVGKRVSSERNRSGWSRVKAAPSTLGARTFLSAFSLREARSVRRVASFARQMDEADKNVRAPTGDKKRAETRRLHPWLRLLTGVRLSETSARSRLG